jgi:hypothetical protein
MYNLIVDKFETDCICCGISQEAKALYKHFKTIFVDFLPINSDEICFGISQEAKELYLQYVSTQK